MKTKTKQRGSWLLQYS